MKFSFFKHYEAKNNFHVLIYLIFLFVLKNVYDKTIGHSSLGKLRILKAYILFFI